MWIRWIRIRNTEKTHLLKGQQHKIKFYLRMLKLLTNASPAVTAVSPVSILKVVVSFKGTAA